MESRTFVIRLKDLRFFSRIGVFDQERKVGNEFRVDFYMKIDASAFLSERLETSVSYAWIYEIIGREMNREWKLLESVAKSIVDNVLAAHPATLEARVEITKLAVPVSGIQGSCSVEYCFRAGNP